MSTNQLQIWKRKCGCTTSNLLACPICGKCGNHCECTDGDRNLYTDLAKNQLNRSIKKATEVQLEKLRANGLRQGECGETMPD